MSKTVLCNLHMTKRKVSFSFSVVWISWPHKRGHKSAHSWRNTQPHIFEAMQVKLVWESWPNGWNVGLVTRGCGFESRLRQELSTTEVRPLSKAPNPQLLPGRRIISCPLLQVCVCVCVCVCVHLDGLNPEHTFHCWLYSVQLCMWQIKIILLKA